MTRCPDQIRVDFIRSAVGAGGSLIVTRCPDQIRVDFIRSAVEAGGSHRDSVSGSDPSRFHSIGGGGWGPIPTRKAPIL